MLNQKKKLLREISNKIFSFFSGLYVFKNMFTHIRWLHYRRFICKYWKRRIENHI